MVHGVVEDGVLEGVIHSHGYVDVLYRETLHACDVYCAHYEYTKNTVKYA